VSDSLNADAWRAAQGSEAIIYKSSWIAGYSIAEKLGVPCVGAMLFPLTPTRAFPSFLVGGGADRGPLLNRLVWGLTEQVVWQLTRQDDNALRRDLLHLRRLPFLGPAARQRAEAMPILYAYSPSVLPRPDDWPDHVHVTGYWFLDPPLGWRPPADVLRFLEAGPPPVSIGFGSMASSDREATLRTVLQALRISGQRGVLLSGWAGLGRGQVLPDTVLRAENLPHSWLFPRMAAVVHHGGAGTTGAGLRAGVPSVLTPLAADQHNWARRVHALGAGPAPVAFQGLDAKGLANAIRDAATDPGMRQRAAEIGGRIAAEDGLGQAIDLFMKHVERSRRAA
jgi:UDP:flavonoid glycosyltransferase YjiC (YdhE family)